MESQKWRKAFSRTQTIIRERHMLVSYTIRVLTKDLETMSLQIHVCPIFVQHSDLEKMTEQIIFCLFLFLFTPTKQASSLHFLVHFPVHRGHFVIDNKPKLCPNKEMNGRVRLGLNGFHMKGNKTKTSMSWLTFITVLFANFAEGLARITSNLN